MPDDDRDFRFDEPRVALPYGWRRTPLPMSEDEYDHRANNTPERWEQDDE